MKKGILLGIAFTVILASLMAGCNDENGGGGGEELPTAPEFTLTSVDGDSFSLSDHLGKVVVLDFMFVDCAPCQQEMEHLEDVYDNYLHSQVVIISIDCEDTEEYLISYWENNSYEWTFAVDTDNMKNKYEISQYPTLVIVNKEGEIAFNSKEEKLGVTDYDTLSSEIDKLL